MRQVNVAVLGATGLVGTEVLRILEERSFPVGKVRLAGSFGSAGQEVQVWGERRVLEEPGEGLFRDTDVAFSAVSADVARRLAPEAAKAGCIFIDKSSAFRMDPSVPLVVPEVNGILLGNRPPIVASPNCSTITLVMALGPLRTLAPITSVEVATYQAVSGSGRDAVVEMERQLDGPVTPKVYPKPILWNVLPQVDSFDENGHSVEEMKLIRETRRILDQPALPVAATAVRVPVYRSHSEAVTVAFASPVSVEDARQALLQAPGIRFVDLPDVPTPLEAAGNDLTWVGRLRRNPARENALQFFVVSDNLRKGAATNAVQIAETVLGLTA